MGFKPSKFHQNWISWDLRNVFPCFPMFSHHLPMFSHEKSPWKKSCQETGGRLGEEYSPSTRSAKAAAAKRWGTCLGKTHGRLYLINGGLMMVNDGINDG